MALRQTNSAAPVYPVSLRGEKWVFSAFLLESIRKLLISNLNNEASRPPEVAKVT